MNSKRMVAFLLVAVLLVMMVGQAASVGGAAFTTFNASIDGANKDVCKNSAINCNIYGAKEYVWLNGGPDANHLKPDGWYFFTVLEPGGQPNPNDRGGVPDKNLSDDYDLYTNRTFRTAGGEVVEYAGSHWLDSGVGRNKKTPDGLPPYIRLFPYSDTTNPGGVYIMSICFLGYAADGSDWGYPVNPRDCKYDAFKVREGRMDYSFFLSGMKFHDLYADGVNDYPADPGLPGWDILVSFTSPVDGSLIVVPTILTGEEGYWEYSSPVYSFTGRNTPLDITVTVCENLQPNWYQSYPTADGCHTFPFTPTGFNSFTGLDFGNYQKVSVEACKIDQYDNPVVGWPVALTEDGVVVDEQVTGANGCYVWEDLMPGIVYDVHEGMLPGWFPLGDEDFVFDRAVSGQSYSHTFQNAYVQGCTPGYWKNHSRYGPAPVDSWPPTGYDPDQLVETVFARAAADPYAHLGDSTLLQALSFQGGDSVAQKAEILLRAAVASVLNAAHPDVYFPLTVGEIVASVNAALDSQDPMEIVELAGYLDAANNAFYREQPPAHCPLGADPGY